MTSRETIDELKRLDKEATPGPWNNRRLGRVGNGVAISQEEQLCNSAGVGVFILTHDGSSEGNANVELIAAARNALPALLDAAERCAVYAGALQKINAIRNSIVGMQKINWSEHTYPLVAALNEAGIAGMPYEEAREHFGTMLERTVAAEQRVRELEAAIAPFLRALELYEKDNEKCGASAKMEITRFNPTLGELRELRRAREAGKKSSNDAK